MTAPVISAGDLVERLDKAVDRCKAILAHDTYEGLNTDFALMTQYRLSEAADRIHELEAVIALKSNAPLGRSDSLALDRFCTDHDPDRHCPDAATMKQRIADRFAALASTSTGVNDAMVERALAAFNETINNPQMVPCDRCDGKGYHHGFGEDGASPDWCSKCGGNQYDVVPGEEARAMRAALLAAHGEK